MLSVASPVGVASGGGGGDRELDRVSSSVSDLHDALFEVVRGHMKERNSRKLTDACEFLSSAKYLRALAFEPSLSPARTTILSSVSTLEDPSSSPSSSSPSLGYRSCRDLERNRDKMREIVSNPTFQGLMRNKSTRSLVMDWVTSPGAPRELLRCVELCDAVEGFKGISGRGMLKSRAEVIFGKYIREGARRRIGDVDASQSDRIADSLSSGGSVRKDLFDSVVSLASSRLEGAVWRETLPSSSSSSKEFVPFVDSEQFDGVKAMLREIEGKVKAERRRQGKDCYRGGEHRGEGRGYYDDDGDDDDDNDDDDDDDDDDEGRRKEDDCSD